MVTAHRLVLNCTFMILISSHIVEILEQGIITAQCRQRRQSIEEVY